MATASELLKDLPSRNSTNFSQYNHCSFKNDSKRYVRLKTHEDTIAAQVIQMDETSMLNRELAKIQENNSPKKPNKRSNESSSNGHSGTKHRRKDYDDDDDNDEMVDEESNNSDN